MISDPHYHLVVNHFPLVGLAIGILIMIAGFILKNDLIKATGLGVFILAAISAYFAMASGERAEEAVEHLAGFDRKVIHNHEELAETLEKILYGLGLISIVGIWSYVKKKSFYNILTIIALVIGLVGLYMSYDVGNSGGIIHHDEIRVKEEIGPEVPD